MSAEYLILVAQGRHAPALARLDASVAARSEVGGPVHIHAQRPGRMHLTVGTAFAAPFFDGIAVFGDRGVRSAADLPAEPAEGRGNYMLARRRNGLIEIEADPLGSYPLFVLQQDGLFGASNNLFLLADAASAAGLAMPKSLTLYSFIVTTGNGALGLTGYAPISMLPLGATIRIGDDDRGTLGQASPRTLIYSDRPYAELLDDAAQEITRTARALAAMPWRHKVCDLSGGMDSRLAVAALAHEGLADDFLFHTHGAYPDPDANTASHIRAEFSLRYINDVYQSPQKIGRWENFIRTTSRAFGLMSMYYGVGVGSDARDILHLGGGYGETYRGFYGIKFSNARDTQPLESFKQSFATRGKYLEAKELKQCLQDLTVYGARLAESGIILQDASDYYYLENRSRYHFGTKWRSSNISRSLYHLLYSPVAIRAGYALTARARDANRVGYDLMRRLCPRLTQIPFAEKSWDPVLGTDAPPPVTRETPRLGRPDETPGTVDGLAPPKSLRDEGAGTRPAKWDMLDGMLQSFRKASTPDGFERLSPAFDGDRVRGYLLRPSEKFTTKNDAWRAYRLITAYAWANDLF